MTSSAHCVRGASERPIAVITVCRNPGAVLRGAVESVRALSDDRILHIIIDGNSTDGTVEYLNEICADLHCWKSEADSGIYDAMNKGWAAAPSDAWVIFIGADDRLLGVPSAAELCAAGADGISIVYGTTLRGAKPFRSRLDATIYFRNTLHHQSMMVDKHVSPAPPFDMRYSVCGDWDFNIRLKKLGARARRFDSLRAFAAPDGKSARRPIKESFLVAYRNAGVAAGVVAWLLALRGRMVVRLTATRERLPPAQPLKEARR